MVKVIDKISGVEIDVYSLERAVQIANARLRAHYDKDVFKIMNDKEIIITNDYYEEH